MSGDQTTRIRCCVPFCNRTNKVMFENDEEWICDTHYSAVSRADRMEYEAAWKEAVKADKRWVAADGEEAPPSIYARVTKAFEVCKVSAIEKALI